jgi:large subunit ribosomal protein L31
MQKNIHPDYHEITVEMTDGSKFKTKSTYGKKGSVLKLDVDPTTHPAWIGGAAVINQNVSKVVKFKEKFSGINFSSFADNKQDNK